MFNEFLSFGPEGWPSPPEPSAFPPLNPRNGTRPVAGPCGQLLTTDRQVSGDIADRDTGKVDLDDDGLTVSRME